MASFYDLLKTDKQREEFARYYERLTGKKFIKPKRKPQLESFSEMEKIMKQKPREE